MFMGYFKRLFGFVLVIAVLASALVDVSATRAEGSVCIIGNGVVLFSPLGDAIFKKVVLHFVDARSGEVLSTSNAYRSYPSPVPGIKAAIFSFPAAMVDPEFTNLQIVMDGKALGSFPLAYLLSIPDQPGGVMSVDNCIGGWIGDGRINDGGDQLAAPMAGYCTDDKGLEVWDISLEGVGTLDFTVNAEDITAALAQAKEIGTHQLVGTGPLDNQLWALTSGELQFHAPGLPGEEGKLYDFIFSAETCA